MKWISHYLPVLGWVTVAALAAVLIYQFRSPLWANAKAFGSWSWAKTKVFGSWSMDKLRPWLRQRLRDFKAARLRKKRAARHAVRQEKKEHDLLNKVIYIASCVLYVLWTLILVYHWSYAGLTKSWAGTSLGWLLFTLASFKQAKKGTRALIWIFNNEAFEWTAGFGIVFAPPVISSIVWIPVTVLESEHPDEPEMVFHGDDKDPLPEISDPYTGEMRLMRRPYRIPTGGKMPTDKYALLRPTGGKEEDAGPSEELNCMMVIEPAVVTRYHIGDGFAFFKRMKGDSIEEKLAYANKELADFNVKVLAREYAKYSVGGVIIKHADIIDVVQEDLEEETETWGIVLDQLLIKPPMLTHDLNKALAKKPTAMAEATAAGYEGTGLGQKEGNRLKGIAEGEKAAATSLGMDASEVFRTEKTVEMLKENKTFVLGAGGIMEAIGIGPALKEALAGKPKLPEPANGEKP